MSVEPKAAAREAAESHERAVAELAVPDPPAAEAERALAAAAYEKAES